MTKEDNEKIFNDIVKDYDKSEHFSGQLCPDQYVGLIKDFKDEDNKAKKDFSFRMDIFNKNTSACVNISDVKNILVLVLESPHTDEFDENGNPIGPANGTTGRNIREHISKIFPNFSNYHLILMNAIPFQCSLGFPLSKKEKENLKRRDEVFGAVWGNFGKIFFKARLKKLLDELQNKGKNVVVVNACTIATDKKENREDLHCMVCRGIQYVMVKNKFSFYHTVHPSSGHWCRKNYKLNDSKINVNERCQNRRKCKQSQIQIVKN